MRGPWKIGWRANEDRRRQETIEFRDDIFPRVPVLKSLARPSDLDQ